MDLKIEFHYTRRTGNKKKKAFLILILADIVNKSTSVTFSVIELSLL